MLRTKNIPKHILDKLSKDENIGKDADELEEEEEDSFEEELNEYDRR